jgi:pimeloyl-ACP methyl ester carboxylesterase
MKAPRVGCRVVPTANLNGIRIYFERSGSGPPLLFLNGSGSTLKSSELVINAFRSRFEVIAHDQRGLGQTAIPLGPYSMAEYAADALALLDHVGLPSCRVVGVSFGGMVAQELAVTAPERVERLALVCTSPGGPDRASYPLHELATLPTDERARVYLPLLDQRFDEAWLASHDSDRALVEAMAARVAGDKSDEQIRGEREQLAARSHHDVRDRLAKVSCPTLVAGGRFDGIAPPENSETIAALVPNAELRLYDGGHAFFAQDRRALPEVLDFLEGAGS